MNIIFFTYFLYPDKAFLIKHDEKYLIFSSLVEFRRWNGFFLFKWGRTILETLTIIIIYFDPIYLHKVLLAYVFRQSIGFNLDIHLFISSTLLGQKHGNLQESWVHIVPMYVKGCCSASGHYFSWKNKFDMRLPQFPTSVHTFILLSELITNTDQLCSWRALCYYCVCIYLISSIRASLLAFTFFSLDLVCNFVENILAQHNPQIVALSALLTASNNQFKRFKFYLIAISIKTSKPSTICFYWLNFIAQKKENNERHHIHTFLERESFFCH